MEEGQGSKPESSWILVGLVTAEPQQDILKEFKKKNKKNKKKTSLSMFSSLLISF